MEPSEHCAIVAAAREPGNEDPFSLSVPLDRAGCEAGMFLRVDSDLSAGTESVQVRSILNLARVLEGLLEEEKEEGSEEEDECETGGEHDEAEMLITAESHENSADLTSRMLTIRARK
jgi:hypothetical protein